ncbi:hypothetical protein Lalb_Chr04g0253471 [Lupinus albus]|uniref:Uncharacterized protein n=1 Tax=Lupinus albus TaxID=3870 RepID=A0A6A4QNP3_LUPAL|nr:hypothetical protein Lalb_Chr04g0253471 [Lupinus albus]
MNNLLGTPNSVNQLFNDMVLVQVLLWLTLIFFQQGRQIQFQTRQRLNFEGQDVLGNHVGVERDVI